MCSSSVVVKHLCRVVLLYDCKHARNLVFKLIGEFTKYTHFAKFDPFGIYCRSELKINSVLPFCNHVFVL